MADSGRSRRARKPTPRDDSPPSAGSKGKAARTGKANKKRDDRSALVETWMVKNAEPDKPTADVKTKYAEDLSIPKDEFWDIMKKYALRSKYNCLPDFEQIQHHIKDESRVDLADLKMGQLDYWWETDGDSYRPITANLKNFKPASGLLHHFYTVFIDNVRRRDAVLNHKLPEHRQRFTTDELKEMVKKLTPFREMPEPKVLLVVPRVLPQIRGTYALSQKINGNNVYIRIARGATKGPTLVSVVVNGTTLDVPLNKAMHYATSENVLLLYCKDEKKEGGAADGDGAENYRDVPLRLKVPQTQDIIEADIKNLHNEKFDIDEAEIWPIRDLIPPYQVAGSVDYGALWNGCFCPFPRTSVSNEEFQVQFQSFPGDCFKYFFEADEDTVSEHVSAEDYIIFMTWFANFEEGLGMGMRNVRGLYEALKRDATFSIQSQSESLRSSQMTGAYVVRLCNTKPNYLTIEVLQEREVGDPFDVRCFRVKVKFTNEQTSPLFQPDQSQKLAPAQVTFVLEGGDGTPLVQQEGRLGGQILQRVQHLADLPKTTKLCPLPRNMLSKGRAAALAAGGQKRKHVGQGEEAIPPPISRLGASGVPNFNDETFDMDGSRELAASMVGRETSNVGGAAAVELKPPAEEGGLSTWGQGLPMPLPLDEGLNRDHSLALPGVGRYGSLSAMHGAGGLAPIPPPAGEVGHDMSFGGVGRDMSFSFLDRNLSMGSVGRDMSIDFSPTTAPEGLLLGRAADNGQGPPIDAGQPDQEEPAGKRQRTE